MTVTKEYHGKWRNHILWCQQADCKRLYMYRLERYMKILFGRQITVHIVSDGPTHFKNEGNKK
jgi:hypothetical protein